MSDLDGIPQVSSTEAVRSATVDLTANSMTRRVWTFLGRPGTLGWILIAAGLLWVLAPMTAGGATLNSHWWSAPLRHVDVAAVGMALVVFTAVVALGAVWKRMVGGRPLRVVDEARPLGLMLAIVGALIGVTHWFVLMSGTAADRVVVESGETIQTYETTIAGVSVDRMLPVRTGITQVALDGAVPSVSFEFTEAGSDEPVRQTLELGAGVNVNGYRFTPVGVEPGETRLIGTFRGTGEETISATAGAGQSFQVALEGPEYRVEDIVRNYMGAVGAGAKILEPDGDSYWVFREQPTSADPRAENADRDEGSARSYEPELKHAVSLTELREIPAVVVSVTPVQPLWPVSTGGLLFMVGFGTVIGAGRSQSDDESSR